MKNKTVPAVLFVFACFLLSCEKNTENAIENKGYIQIILTDSPANYQAVLIDLQDVSINYAADEKSWIKLENVHSGIYNLLDYAGGIDTLIASSIVDTGIISQVRLTLGNNNSLVADNDTVELFTPSAQQSGLKVNIHEGIKEGLKYKIVLDFDASKSVVKAGNSEQFNLKPVIRALIDPQDGAIKGSIAYSIDAVVYAIHNSDSIGTYADTAGAFFIGGLNEGIYSVFIEPQAAWKDTLIENISVNIGKITNLGYIELKERN